MFPYLLREKKKSRTWGLFPQKRSPAVFLPGSGWRLVCQWTTDSWQHQVCNESVKSPSSWWASTSSSFLLLVAHLFMTHELSAMGLLCLFSFLSHLYHHALCSPCCVFHFWCTASDDRSILLVYFVCMCGHAGSLILSRLVFIIIVIQTMYSCHSRRAEGMKISVQSQRWLWCLSSSAGFWQNFYTFFVEAGKIKKSRK